MVTRQMLASVEEEGHWNGVRQEREGQTRAERRSVMARMQSEKALIQKAESGPGCVLLSPANQTQG